MNILDYNEKLAIRILDIYEEYLEPMEWEYDAYVEKLGIVT